jgi:hypothetical protein
MLENRYHVLVDSREQKPWSFPVSSRCSGSTSKRLRTGDYTLAGLERKIVIERKGSSFDLYQSLAEEPRWARLQRQLDRMDRVKHPYLVLEFFEATLLKFPIGSGKKQRYRHELIPGIDGEFLFRRLEKIKADHRVQVVFAGPTDGGKLVAELFKEVFFGANVVAGV